MHWVQNEQPIEYHVVRWENSAFHNHDKSDKRKLLGGVSFDGGGAGGAASGSTTQGTGVQNVQSSFLDGYGLAIGSGPDALTGNGKAGNGVQGAEGTAGAGKDTVHIIQGNGAAVENAGILTASEAVSAASVGSPAELNKNTDVIESKETEYEKRRRSFDPRNYGKKMRSAIRSFLQNMKEWSGRDQKRESVKKENKGTRHVTKEDVYEIQANTAYLLDSYNKHGERSTLGK
ncbi:MAG: hypothetical protein NC314_06230 [Roseburia sp.]|nr:hypothetical protein [Ruminococcus sp.]MCM1154371.1 hypothetical protein [Roseburia sp.]MCM1242422.1 hypothetical protein [Roseburia sp.]